jgi:hypothetical protein
MSEQLHPGQHLEADSLNAFLEGALPEHERLECLAHLAECSRCREIVFLAQEPPAAVVAPTPVPWWQRWFAPFPVLSGAAVAGALAVGAWFYMHRAPAPVPYVVARPGPAPQVAPPPAVTPAAPQPNATRESSRSERLAKDSEAAPRTAREFADAPPSAPVFAAPMTPAAPPPPAPPPKAEIARSPALNLAVPLPPTPPPAISGPLRLSILHNRSSAGDLSEVTGSVTDPSGAAIPKANVTLRQIAGTSSGNTKTDERGQFNLSALPPGRYELQIAAEGFRTASGQIELQAQDRAVVAPVLSVGSVAETVEVAAASPSIQTSTATSAKAPRAATGRTDLPTSGRVIAAQDFKKAGATTITRGKLMLTLTSTGTLSFSKDDGKHWKAVKPAWPGKVLELSVRVESPSNPEAFQITTDPGSVWVSRDGTHWFQDSPQR